MDGPCQTLECPACGAINRMWLGGIGPDGRAVYTCRLCGAQRGPADGATYGVGTGAPAPADEPCPHCDGEGATYVDDGHGAGLCGSCEGTGAA